jgi:hypothetical protein
MTEPIYNYVRGVGWQIQTERLFTFKDTDKKYRLEMRLPEPGEYFTTSAQNRNIEFWEQYVSGIKYISSFPKYGTVIPRYTMSILVLVPCE